MMEEHPLSQWLGSQYVIILKNPAGQRIGGVLRALVPEQYLTLDQAVILSTGQFFARLDIRADNVTDILPVENSTFQASEVEQIPAPTMPTISQPAFQDPAILSLTPMSDSTARLEHHQPNTAEKRDPPHILIPADRMTYSSPDEVTDANPPAATLDDFMGQLHISTSEPVGPSSTAEGAAEGEENLSTPTVPSRKDRRRGARGRGRRKNKLNGEDSPAQPTSTQGPGWRQTPILQSTKSFQPFAALKKNQKGRADPNADNGWASEDVTDVQEAGDFDFEGSLAKFDKRRIFDEMKEQDEIAESDRLVSHNRLPRPKPGTAGGKNLHYSENVLDLPPAISKPKETPRDHWKSEADDIGEGDRGSVKDGSGRNSRLRGESRLSMNRRSQSRKASATVSVGGPSRVNSGVITPILRPDSFVLKTVCANPRHQLTKPTPPGLYTVPTNRRIETVTSFQMVAVENVAHHEFGFADDLMAENAGRGISEVAMHALEDPAVKLRAAALSPPTNTTIAILAGNNKSGVRALAAARHLRNRGINVLVCVVGIERERELMEDIRKQARLFRNFGGTIFTKSELFDHISQTANTLNTSTQGAVTLIIDALLGLTISFEELRKSDQATTFELMEWSNRNDGFVIAIDLPSGVEPTSGKVNVIDGAKLYVHPRYVVALGAPKQGLLKALEMGDDQGDIVMVEEWKIFLVDIGLGPLVWRRAATKIRRGIEFDDKWLLELRYQPEVIEEDDDD
ncbi:YjeF N-terminal domain-like protein [Hypoxylon rubiginosum]|uniref:YjeF N-terminal domain-like protein n=1 Tax=Hypoxylon rubiginosum TaxID=110542 RepID=A0ACC0D3I3_9PEZI|nr:YjeF N-terminal domain-like protein [Hypoxylon rubiginosum]